MLRGTRFLIGKSMEVLEKSRVGRDDTESNLKSANKKVVDIHRGSAAFWRTDEPLTSSTHQLGQARFSGHRTGLPILACSIERDRSTSKQYCDSDAAHKASCEPPGPTIQLICDVEIDDR